jgi:hypothetical protein
MTDINSQEQNLLENQILPKSEDFRILVAILDSKWQPIFKMAAIVMETVNVCQNL